MSIEIYKPLFLNEIGKRENNEDSIYPASGNSTENDRLFLVCDGVGGMDKGEVASQLACKSFAHHFSSHSDQFNDSRHKETDFILNAFDAVQEEFDLFFETEPKAKGMGTTLALLAFRGSDAVIAHCGDSRVYHIRVDKILFCTTDHTAVNELLKHGIITPEEAAASAKSNRITRAMQGHSVLRTKPDVHVINDIQQDDYFLLCSDGVYGAVTDDYITEILSALQSEEKKLETFKDLCEANSRDNYSVYLLKVKSVTKDLGEEVKEENAVNAQKPVENAPIVKPNKPSIISKLTNLFKPKPPKL